MSSVTSRSAISIGKPRSSGSPANGEEAVRSTSGFDLIPLSADERSARLERQFAAYADMFQSMRAQAPATLRQLVDVLTLSIASRAATETADPDAHR